MRMLKQPRRPRPHRITIARYINPKTSQRVRKGTPGARKIREQSVAFYATIGRRRVNLGTDDEGQAWVRLHALLRREADRRAGLLTDEDFLDHAPRPLAEHIEEFHAALSDSGAGANHCELLKTRLIHLAELARWRRLPDVTADSCLAALAKLQKVEGRSAQTRNHYLRAIKQFIRWCLIGRRLRENPLIGLRTVPVEADQRHSRRLLTDAEITKLLTATAAAKPRLGMTGPQRALAYKLALATGLRAGELRSLIRGSFDLDAGTVTVAAAYSKHRRRDVIPLPGWLVTELREWFAHRGKCWGNFPERFAGRILKADMKAAGVPWSVDGVDGPLYADFHSLRHWYITQLASQPGIAPKTLMELARHSTPTLTLKVYAKARLHNMRAAVNAIPDPKAAGTVPAVSNKPKTKGA